MGCLKRIKLEFVRSPFKSPAKPLRNPAQVCDIFKKLAKSVQENLIGIYLNDDLEIVSFEMLGIGSSYGVSVAPDEIFRGIILSNAQSFILLHNHPSGKARASDGDREVIGILKAQSKIMRKTFLDFIVLADGGHWSMFEEAEGGEYALGAIN